MSATSPAGLLPTVPLTPDRPGTLLATKALEVWSVGPVDSLQNNADHIT